MSSRKDQLHSYQFMMRRVVSSIMVHETDPEQTPLRRGVGALVGGVMIAAIIAAVFGIVGLLTNSGKTGWRADGAVIVERESGALYVYQNESLRPVLNFASARLIGDASEQVHRVSAKDLVELPREPAVGIPGAPDSLPDTVDSGMWSLCSTLAEDEAGELTQSTVLHIDEQAKAGRRLGSQALLVRDHEDGSHHLIWDSHRYEVVGDDPDGILRSLYGVPGDVLDVGHAWLNGLPSGQDLAPIRIDAHGEQSSALPDYRIGEVIYHPVADREQHYLVRDDGLSPLTEFQVAILRGQYATEPIQVFAQVANDAASRSPLMPRSDAATWPERVPDLAPAKSMADTTVCAVTADAQTPPDIVVSTDAEGMASGIPTSRSSDLGVALADRIVVPPGRVALVRAMPSKSAETGAISLVTDLGFRFPIPSEEELTALGYAPTEVQDIPAGLVARIPEGPTLDQQAALAAAR